MDKFKGLESKELDRLGAHLDDKGKRSRELGWSCIGLSLFCCFLGAVSISMLNNSKGARAFGMVCTIGLFITALVSMGVGAKILGEGCQEKKSFRFDTNNPAVRAVLRGLLAARKRDVESGIGSAKSVNLKAVVDCLEAFAEGRSFTWPEESGRVKFSKFTFVAPAILSAAAVTAAATTAGAGAGAFFSSQAPQAAQGDEVGLATALLSKP
jgi:hypothetical protein